MAHVDISFGNGNRSGSEGLSGRRKSTPAVYGATAGIGVNLSGAVGESGVSGTALRTSDAAMQIWFVQLHITRFDVHSPNFCRDSQASQGS